MGVNTQELKRAVFLDRDGVLTRLVWHRKNKEYGAPFNAGELRVYLCAAGLLKKLRELGFKLFVISNQPDYAKGLTTLKNIKAVNKKVRDYFSVRDVKFSGYYYCLHHPQATEARYRKLCGCRKPAPLFVQSAKKKHRLDMAASWFIGDCDSDVFCGQAAGTRTILINEKKSQDKRGKSDPDFFAKDLKGAVNIIIGKEKG